MSENECCNHDCNQGRDCPLRKKELTDEEINWLAKAYSTMEGELNAPAFARAILRKAQGK